MRAFIVSPLAVFFSFLHSLYNYFSFHLIHSIIFSFLSSTLIYIRFPSIFAFLPLFFPTHPFWRNFYHSCYFLAFLLTLPPISLFFFIFLVLSPSFVYIRFPSSIFSYPLTPCWLNFYHVIFLLVFTLFQFSFLISFFPLSLSSVYISFSFLSFHPRTPYWLYLYHFSQFLSMLLSLLILFLLSSFCPLLLLSLYQLSFLFS